MSGKGYLSGMGFSLDEVLKKAALPEDLFARQTPSLTAEEYFRFMEAIDALSPDEQTPVHLAASDGIEAFLPPIFAAYCSRNALVCLKRLAQYKPLTGALLYQVEETETEISVEILSADPELELPEILIGIEFAFLVGLIRKATKEPVTPLSATVKRPMKNRALADFIGKPVTVGSKNRLVFSKEDALVPFISRNESMWEFFEPELKRRLSMMETDDSYAARVRSALMELLPSGECTVDDVARSWAAAQAAGGGHELPETAQPHAGAAGEVLPCQHRYDRRGYRLPAGVSGDRLLSPRVHRVDGADDSRIQKHGSTKNLNP